jgi:uncharacterized flavoprotein (TIGR03862 family)
MQTTLPMPTERITDLRPGAVIIGAGPAGLMAAEVLAAAGLQVDVFDAMASVGRKFLLAGRGGLNLSHAEDSALFLSRYSPRATDLAPMLEQFGAQQLRDWAMGLGIETFVGSSGRIFPVGMKAAPLLRAWLTRLRAAGVRFHMHHRWIGWDDDTWVFSHREGQTRVHADNVLLALGGGSWARLGSDGAWLPLLVQRGVEVTPLTPVNCGFDVVWSAHFIERHAGQPVKNVTLATQGGAARRSEFIVTANGVEGTGVYALSAQLAQQIAAQGNATLTLDLLPGMSAAQVHTEVSRPRASRSLSSHLQSRLGLKDVKTALLREVLPREVMADAVQLAGAIKALPITLVATRPLDEAISSAGGVTFAALDQHSMLHALPGVFCAGEMIDWSAPTGGYLLTACFASGVAAGRGMLARLAAQG